MQSHTEWGGKLLRGIGSFLCFVCATQAHALGGPRYVTATMTTGAFALAQNGTATPLLVGEDDWPGVTRAASDFADDVKRVTTEQPVLTHDATGLRGGEAVLIGTIGKSPLIDELIRRHKLDVSEVVGPMGIGGDDHRRPPHARSATGAGDCGQRQARHDLRDIRPVGADWSLAVVLVGRCAGAASRTRSMCNRDGTCGRCLR